MTYERPNIMRMNGYSWGEQPENEDSIKLNTNENPYPPSPNLNAVLSQITLNSLRLYPHPTADTLRDHIAKIHSLKRENILITHGGDEALRLSFTTFLDPKHCFGMTDPSYSLYPVLSQINDSPVIRIPLEPDWKIPEHFSQTLNDSDVKLACIVNPHAPSGHLSSGKEVKRIAEKFRGLLLVDEAYVDFVDPELQHDLTYLVEELENILILRTFSKGYSLAGLRLGYLIGNPKLIDPIIRKTRDSYNIGFLEQQLGLEAIKNRDYASNTWDLVRKSREKLKRELQKIGFKVYPSQANFLLVEIDSSEMLPAESIYTFLKSRGIFVRYFDTERLNNKLRISIGTPKQNDKLVSELINLLSRNTT